MDLPGGPFQFVRSFVCLSPTFLLIGSLNASKSYSIFFYELKGDPEEIETLELKKDDSFGDLDDLLPPPLEMEGDIEGIVVALIRHSNIRQAVVSFNFTVSKKVS